MSLIKSKQSLILKYLSSKNLSLYNNYTINVNDVCRRHTSTTSTSKGQALSVSNLTGSVHLSPDEHKPKLDLSFENSQLAFKAKSSLELLRGYLVFQLCSLNFLIENQKQLLNITRKLLGKRLFSLVMKSTFYGHFVAGEDQNDIRLNVEKMMKYGVKSILDYSAEEDLESQKVIKTNNKTEIATISKLLNRKYFDTNEIYSDKNARIFMDCIDAVSDVTNATGLAAVKLTSLIRPDLLLKLSSLMSQVKEYNLKNKDQNRNIFEWKSLVSNSDIEFAKSFNNIAELKSNEEIIFSEKELGEIRNMFLRIDKIVDHAKNKNVRIFIDAEQTYFQAAIQRLTIELMRNYNKNKCIILNTYQNYLKSAYDTIKEDIELANKEDFCFGAKLVRGAYMEQERERAKQMKYPDPINVDYEATTRMYEKSLTYCLDEINKKPLGHICVMVASHNEETVKFAVEKMDQYKIKPADRIVCFGQLLGMCDYISFYLGGVGYSVYKYVPYGPVEEVLPYLSRRATENRGIFEKVKKEKRLIATELRRRFKSILFN